MKNDPQTMGHLCINFYLSKGKCTILLVPFENTNFVPRIGETVLLPTEDIKPYKVKGVVWEYAPNQHSDRECQGNLVRIRVIVEEIKVAKPFMF